MAHASRTVVAAGRLISSWATDAAGKMLIVEPRAEDLRRMASVARAAAREHMAHMTEQDLKSCAELYLRCVGYVVVRRDTPAENETWVIARSEDGEDAGIAAVTRNGFDRVAAERTPAVRFVVSLGRGSVVEGQWRTIGRRQVENLLVLAVVRELQDEYIQTLGALPRLRAALVDAANAEYPDENTEDFIETFESIVRG